MTTQQLKTLVVDDEPLARARLIELLKAHADVVVVGEAANGAEAVEMVSQRQAELVLMDIRMPGIDGIEAARHLAQLPEPPAVVFCTAYDDQALAAFDAHAVDYLLKPVRRERLAEALTRARRFVGVALSTEQTEAISGTAARTHLCARLRGTLKLVALDDVLYLLADTKYVEVHTAKESVLIEESLVQLEEEFASRLVRVHRNCLVAKSAISGLSRALSGEVSVLLRGTDAKLEVSRRNLAGVRKLLRSL